MPSAVRDCLNVATTIRPYHTRASIIAHQVIKPDDRTRVAVLNANALVVTNRSHVLGLKRYVLDSILSAFRGHFYSVCA